MKEYRIVEKGKKFTIEVKRIKTESFFGFCSKTYVIWDACDSNGDSTFTLSAAEYKSLKKARKKIKKWNTENVYHYSDLV
jgi:hypothetical protein